MTKTESRLLKHQQRTYQEDELPSILFYEFGVKLDPKVWFGKSNLPRDPEDRLRGSINGWSHSSRKRMREYILNHKPIVDSDAYNVTLTIPGPIISEKLCKELFKMFRNRITKMGFCAVWRKEVQVREQTHYHLVLHIGCGLFDSHSDVKDLISVQWLECLKHSSHKEYPKGFEWIYKSGFHQLATHRNTIMKANIYASDCQFNDGDSFNWYRYMVDHATKRKDDQISESGRHWGYINKKGFKLVQPYRSDFLDKKKYARFLRTYQRLCTAQCRTSRKGCPFGKRLNKRRRFGRSGKAVLFSRSPVVERILEWALSEPETALESPKPVVGDTQYSSHSKPYTAILNSVKTSER